MRFFVLSIGLMACAVGAGCTRRPVSDADILLFTGDGASRNDVKAVEAVLQDAHLAYATADSSFMNHVDVSALGRFHLLIVPGGNFVEMGQGLTTAAATTVRTAVQNGLNYLGICAGGFLAGDSPYNGFNLTSGVRFGFYSAEARGVRKSAVAIALRNGTTREHYWEDGPQFTGWGSVVGTYPDGTPAIAEGPVGRGWVLLTGVHAEAPESWRRGMTFATPVRDDNAYAAALVRAALEGTALSAP